MLYKVSRDLQKNSIQYYNTEAYNTYVPMLRLIYTVYEITMNLSNLLSLQTHGGKI